MVQWIRSLDFGFQELDCLLIHGSTLSYSLGRWWALAEWVGSQDRPPIPSMIPALIECSFARWSIRRVDLDPVPELMYI